jgi:hypothetical protein
MVAGFLELPEMPNCQKIQIGKTNCQDCRKYLNFETGLRGASIGFFGILALMAISFWVFQFGLFGNLGIFRNRVSNLDSLAILAFLAIDGAGVAADSSQLLT